MAQMVYIEGIEYKVPEGLALCELWPYRPTMDSGDSDFRAYCIILY